MFRMDGVQLKLRLSEISLYREKLSLLARFISVNVCLITGPVATEKYLSYLSSIKFTVSLNV